MTLPDFTAVLKANAVDGIMRLSDPDGSQAPGVELEPVQNLAVTTNAITAQTVGWSYPYDNHDGFEHQYRNTAIHTAWQASTVLGPAVRSFSVSGLTANTTIGHRVRATLDDDASPWLEIWHATEDEAVNPDPPDTGDFVYHDFGWGDFDASSPYEMQNSVGDENWGRWWGIYKRSSIEVPNGESHIAMLEDINGDRFEFVYPKEAFSNPDSFVESRPLKFRLRGEIHVRAGNLPRSGPLYITIRYKDQLIPGDYPGCAMFTGRSERFIGSLGGLNDHRWKTSQFSVNASDLIWVGDKIHLSFGDEYSDDNCGQLNIDKMKISTTTNKHEFPPDAQGMWQPLSEPNKHADIYADHEWYSGETPKFRYGIYMEIGMDLGSDATRTSISNHPNDQFQNCEDAKMNVILKHMWYHTLDSFWIEFPSDPAPPGCKLAEGGTDEWVTQCAGHGLQFIPNTLTNIWPELQSPSNAGSPGIYANHMDFVAEAEDMLSRFVGDDDLLAVNWKDELDHDGTRDKYPIEAQRMMYVRTKASDPNRPVYCSMMGFHWEKSWEWWSDVFDICGNDRYFDDGANGTWEKLESTIRDAAARMLTAREVFKIKRKLLIYIPHASEGSDEARNFPGGKRTPNQLEIVMQHYLGVCCGAKASIYFRYEHPTKNSPAGVTSMWAGLNQVGDELFGAEGIGDALVAPSTELDVMGENGVVSTGSSDMYHIYQQMQSGEKFLITLNGLHSSRTVTFNVSGVPNGTYPVRFESRDIIVSGGSFTDTFSDWERHVYEF